MVFAPDTGCAHPCEPWLAAKQITHTNDGAYDIINVTYEGLWHDKYPSGGCNIGTMESPIALHPNYKARPSTSWGTIFGAGKSPNEYGRILDEDGAHKAFGPLPDNKDGRPNGLHGNPDAEKLMGVESFLDPGQMTYKYQRMTTDAPGGSSLCQAYPMGRWACDFVQYLGKIVTIESQYVAPCPLPPANRNWLFVSLTEDQKPIGTQMVYTTSIECLSSGHGGWNGLLYQNGGALVLA